MQYQSNLREPTNDIPGISVTPAKIRHAVFTKSESADGFIAGKIEPGFELYGVIDGQFSQIDLMAAILSEIGPAHVIISTWTAANDDIDAVWKMQAQGKIEACQWLVDRSLKRRHPGAYAHLVQTFGTEHVQQCPNHTKVTILEGVRSEYRITILSSANLNPNRNLEFYFIRDDAELHEFNRRWILEAIHGSGNKD